MVLFLGRFRNIHIRVYSLPIRRILLLRAAFAVLLVNLLRQYLHLMRTVFAPYEDRIRTLLGQYSLLLGQYSQFVLVKQPSTSHAVIELITSLCKNLENM